jgi:hypothetical protein
MTAITVDEILNNARAFTFSKAPDGDGLIVERAGQRARFRLGVTALDAAQVTPTREFAEAAIDDAIEKGVIDAADRKRWLGLPRECVLLLADKAPDPDLATRNYFALGDREAEYRRQFEADFGFAPDGDGPESEVDEEHEAYMKSTYGGAY